MTQPMQGIMQTALAEDRLFWCVTDQYGRPCNGGRREERMDQPRDGMPGEWSKPINNPKICDKGYHVTTDPLRWVGLLVWLVEVDEVLDKKNDKRLVHRRRALSVVDPDWCIDQRIWAAACRPLLNGARLDGARLDGANLNRVNFDGASLCEASLYEANLYGANLNRVRLDGARLDRANLYRASCGGASLCKASLYGANLYGVNFDGASLYEANLYGANLYGAICGGANLYGANLYRARLDGASLGDWERGPDGYARRKK